MAIIKIDHIISFSSEDPSHVAQNVLSTNPSKKWKCQNEGEQSASIILQLEKASIISGIDIGNEHSAYVEVLVSRSSSSSDYKVLLIMSTLMTPLESRESKNINKVRMFGYNELQSPERDEKWDRVKIFCTQPFNRHVRYGLSFITLHSTEKRNEMPNSSFKLGNYTVRPDSPNDLSPGSLFSKRKEVDMPMSAAAAIREASFSTDSTSSKYKPNVIVATEKSPNTNTAQVKNITPKIRNRDELLYNRNDDDNENNCAKINKLIENNNKAKLANIILPSTKLTDSTKKKKKQANGSKEKCNVNEDKNDAPSKTAQVQPSTSYDHSKNANINNKRKIAKDSLVESPKKKKPNKLIKPFNKLLDGVVISISGIQNPERADIRSNALEMGAKYKADWDNSCTHLTCAFTNTPKYNQVKGKGKIVNRMWVNECHRRRKRLPWRRFALDRNELSKPESEEEISEEKEEPEVQFVFNRTNGSIDDTDTEDEIERIESLSKTRQELPNNNFSAETDEENYTPLNSVNNVLPNLPEFFSNLILHIDNHLNEDNIARLTQYITAYNGTIANRPADLVDYVISTPENSNSCKDTFRNARIVNPNWIWACHNNKKFVAPDTYEL